jgi:signal transduction histidine kinase
MIRPPRATLRLRITALAAVVVALVLAVSAVALVGVQRRQLTANVDSSLAQRADDLVELLAASDQPPRQLGPGILDGFAQLVGPDGQVLSASANLAGEPALRFDPGSGEAFRSASGIPVDDDVFRVLSRRVETPEGPAVLHLGANLGDVTEGTTQLANSLALGIPAVVLLLTLLVWWLTGRLLAPVEAIRSEVAEIGAGDLHRRVPQPPGDDEIGRLARTMNGMLDRLQDAVRRQQRFVADASHELRSPLTRIRTELEVDLARGATVDASSVLAEVLGMQRLVEDLLQLARADAGAAGNGRVEAVDLDDLVLREVRRIRAGGRVEVDGSGVSGAEVTGDPDQLARAVRNLVDNAVRHATARVTITLAETDRTAELTVADDGPGIPAEDRERVFERFGRLDEARGRETGGTGLGLAIAREIVQRHGGSIAVDTGAAGGARFVVRLPTTPG